MSRQQEQYKNPVDDFFISIYNGGTRKTNLKSEFLLSAVCFRFFQRKGQKNMKRKLSMGKLRLFFLAAAFIGIAMAFSACLSIRAMASESLIRIYDDSGVIRREAVGSRLFCKPLMPGESDSAELSIVSELKEPVYYELRTAADESSELYDILLLSIADEDGRKLYDGRLKNAALFIGPHNRGKTKKYILTLTMPATAGKGVSGKKAEFDLLFTFKSEAVSSGGGNTSNGDTGSGGTGSDNENTPGKSDDIGNNAGKDSGNGAGNSGSAIGGGDKGSGGNESSGSSLGSGQGHRGSKGSGSSGGNGSRGTGSGAYGSADGSLSKADSSKSGGSVSEENNIITGSRYDRDFSFNDDGTLSDEDYKSSADKGRKKGFFGAEYVSGGGGEKMYPKPELSVRVGIDSGIWERDESGFWHYVFKNGDMLKGGFALIKNPYRKNAAEYSWYCFDAAGRLMIGWIRAADDIWYHSHEESDGDSGSIEEGWITGSEDRALYYAGETDAAMKTGWIGFRDNKDSITEYYYFARLSDTYRQNWFFNTAAGRWLYDRLGYRCYGSMYRNEATPDGYTVGSNGKWIKQKA